MFINDSILSMTLLESSKLEELELQQNHVAQQAFLRNAILNYSKCFSSSGKGEITLQKKDVFRDKQKLLSIHNRVIALRNNFFAHNDTTDIDDLTFASKEVGEELVVKAMYEIKLPNNEFLIMLELFQYVGRYIKLSIDNRTKHLEKQIGKKINLFRRN